MKGYIWLGIYVKGVRLVCYIFFLSMVFSSGVVFSSEYSEKVLKSNFIILFLRNYFLK